MKVKARLANRRTRTWMSENALFVGMGGFIGVQVALFFLTWALERCTGR